MQLAHGPFGGITHHQERKTLLHTQVQDAQDVRMHQSGNGSGFAIKPLYLAAAHVRTQHFDGGLGLQKNMLAEVDLGKASRTKQAKKTVVPELLADPIRHDAPLLVNATLSSMTVQFVVYPLWLFSSTSSFSTASGHSFLNLVPFGNRTV